MTPTSLPTAPAVQSPTSTTNPAGAAAGAPTDFLLMLGQLVGAATPALAAPGKTLLASDTESTSADAEPALPELLLAAPLPVPIEPPKLPSAAPPQTVVSAPGPQVGKDVVSAMIAGLVSASSEQMTTAEQGAEALEALNANDSSTLQHTLAEAGQRARTTALADATLSRPVYTPVGSQTWADEIGARVTMMAEQGRQTASLRLSPEHLGPLEIRVTINDDQAQVWFGAAHADTRAAIEHALPRLRELFAAQGMSLTDAGVSHEAPREQTSTHHPASASSTRAGGDDSTQINTVAVKLGLVDAYA